VRDWAGVKRLFKQGVKIRQIARQMSMSKNTIKKLLKQSDEPKYERRAAKTKIAAHKDKIKAWYVEPVRATAQNPLISNNVNRL
jgi:IS30 family transposase